MNFNNKIVVLLFTIFILSICISSINANDIDESSNIISIDNSISIQNTINEANDNDIILLNPGKYNEWGINVNKNLTFIGNSSTNNVVVDGNQKNTMFFVKEETTVTFINITFINGKTYDFGGAISSINANVYVDNCIFINNTAVYHNGGAIDTSGTSHGLTHTPGYLFVNNSLFIGNYAGHDGGAITTLYGTSEIYNSVFINNYAIRDGGAIRGGIYTRTNIFNCTFIDNYAQEWGGAVYVWTSDGYIINSTFINNSAGFYGGAFAHSGRFTVKGSTIINNTAGISGGAVFVTQMTSKIVSYTIFNDNIIIDNSAPTGDVIYIDKTSARIFDFENNDWGEEDPDWNSLFNTSDFMKNPSNWIIKKDLINEDVDNNKEEISQETDYIFDLNNNASSIFNNLLNNYSSMSATGVLSKYSTNSSDYFSIDNSIDKNDENKDWLKVETVEKDALNNNIKILIVIALFIIILVVGYKKF